MLLSIGIGALLSVVLGLVYVIVLREPGPVFYLFAGLVFLVSPFIGGIAAAWKTPSRRLRAYVIASAAVFGMSCGLFFFAYAILPQFDRTSVQLPESCDGFDGSLDSASRLVYTVPNNDIGILITESADTAVVAVIDNLGPAISSTGHVINKRDNTIVWSMPFPNDVVSASIDEGTVYIYNDKLGYLIDSQTGEREDTILLIDNYGGLSETDRPMISRASSGFWYMETSAVISSWHIDGKVKSRPNMIFNGIARGCFIFGDSHEVTKL